MQDCDIVIINGLHRSGTMLLSRLLNALPDTFIIKDGLRIPWIFYRVETDGHFRYPTDFYLDNELNLDLHKKVKDKLKLNRILCEEIDALKFVNGVDNEIKNLLSLSNLDGTYKDIFNSIFFALSNRTNSKIVGTKNTHMFFYRKAMLDCFPKMKWIDIMRDPRGWYCSTKVSHPSNIIKSALLWKKIFNRIYSTKRSDGRYKFITFENLILNSTETLNSLGKFLDIKTSIDENWINNVDLSTNNGSKWYPNPSYTKDGKKIHGDQNIQKSDEYKTLDKLPVYRWKDRLSFIEKIFIKMVIGNYLKIFQTM